MIATMFSRDGRKLEFASNLNAVREGEAAQVHRGLGEVINRPAATGEPLADLAFRSPP